jgi:hypothetical protein
VRQNQCLLIWGVGQLQCNQQVDRHAANHARAHTRSPSCTCNLPSTYTHAHTCQQCTQDAGQLYCTQLFGRHAANSPEHTHKPTGRKTVRAYTPAFVPATHTGYEAAVLHPASWANSTKPLTCAHMQPHHGTRNHPSTYTHARTCQQHTRGARQLQFNQKIGQHATNHSHAGLPARASIRPLARCIQYAYIAHARARPWVSVSASQPA